MVAGRAVQDSMRHSRSTSSFQSSVSHDNTKSERKKSTLRRSTSNKSFDANRSIDRACEKEVEKMIDFQNYIRGEIRDIHDFKRFLGQLRISLDRQKA